MAADRSVFRTVSNSTELELDLFETSVKDKLKWSKKKWEAEGLENTRMHRLINSVTYWSKKLKPAFERTNIIVTLYNSEKDVTVSLLDLVDAILGLEEKIEIVGFSDFRNPKYLCIYFENEQARNYVENNLKKVNDNLVVYLSWAKEADVKTIKIHWLTMTMNLEAIKQNLDTYFDILEQKKESKTLMNGKTLKSGKVTFRAKVKNGIDVVNVPHLIYVGGLEALVTVQGRPPLCLTCDRLGHIAKVCPTPYCGTCRELKAKDHLCGIGEQTRSYASVLKPRVLPAEHDDWSEVSNLTKAESKDVNSFSTKESIVLQSTLDSTAAEDPSWIELGEEGKLNITVQAKTGGIDRNVVVVTQGKRSLETSSKEIEESDNCSIDDSDVETSQSEALKNMDNYIKELSKFKADVSRGGGLASNDQVLTSGEEPQAEAMDLEAQNLKRKLNEQTTINEPSRSEIIGSDTGWVRNYGRSGRRRQANKNRFLEDSEEERKFVFKD